MTHDEFEQLRNGLNKACEDILLSKGAAYAGQTNRFENFEKNAGRLGTDPLLVWAIYFNKHIDAILNYVKLGIEGPEGIEGNFLDARNYIDLGYGLVKKEIAEKAEREKEIPF